MDLQKSLGLTEKFLEETPKEKLNALFEKYNSFENCGKLSEIVTLEIAKEIVGILFEPISNSIEIISLSNLEHEKNGIGINFTDNCFLEISIYENDICIVCNFGNCLYNLGKFTDYMKSILS